MFISLVVVISLSFVIIPNFPCFNSSLFSLFSGPYVPKIGSLTFLSSFEASDGVDHGFLSFLTSLLEDLEVYLCYIGFYFYCKSDYYSFSSFYEDFLQSWDFIFFSNFVKNFGKPEKLYCKYHFSLLWNILIIFLIFSFGNLCPIIQASCKKYRFHSLI